MLKQVAEDMNKGESVADKASGRSGAARMPRRKRATPSIEPVELNVDDRDWETVEPQTMLWMLQQMILIRRFEEALLQLKNQDLINGPVHTSVGQEAVAVGVAAALRKTDWITGSHRAHHQYLAKVLCACAPPDFNPLRRSLTPTMHEEVRVLLCEVMGLADGCSGGRGGSMHLYNREAGVAGTNAIVAGGVAHAAGVAWADQFLGRDGVTVAFFGDGALYQGVTHEASNLASLWRAPVIYFIENNLYAVATGAGESCSIKHLAQAAAAYGMQGLRVDGMDALAVKLAIETVVRRRDEGWLPCYVEADVYRYFHHAGDAPGSAFGYRSVEEEATWRKRDPIEQVVRRLKALGHLDDRGLRRLRKQAASCVNAAVADCTETTGDGQIVVREARQPDAASIVDGLRDDSLLTGGGPFVEVDTVTCDREVKYSDAIAAVTERWLEKDPTVVVMGEEVANFGGGAYGATKGLPQKYPGRIRNTPISEAGFCGLACGAALNGLHPVVEIMFTSFALVAADQLFNQIAQITHIYGGRPSLPLVVRTRVAIGLGYGAQHSMDPTALYALFPGWRIFVPTTPFDYVGLFNAAMQSKSPTVLIEHHEFYARKGSIPSDTLDYLVQPGRAKVLRSGSQVTAVAYGHMVNLAMQATAELQDEGLDAEVIDLRTVDDAGMDYALIGRSLEKTGRLVTVEQAMRCNCIGAKIVKECERRFFDYLDGASVCVNAPDVPLPVSRRLEQACMPSLTDVKEALRSAALRHI